MTRNGSGPEAVLLARRRPEPVRNHPFSPKVFLAVTLILFGIAFQTGLGGVQAAEVPLPDLPEIEIDIEAAMTKRWKPHRPESIKPHPNESLFRKHGGAPTTEEKTPRQEQDQNNSPRKELTQNRRDQHGSSNSARTVRPQVAQKDIDLDMYEEREWLTNSTDYVYWENFWYGMQLVNKFDNADLCEESFVYFIDDITIFRNNFTKEFFFTAGSDRVLAYPLISFAHIFGGNFSTIFTNCFEFGVAEVWEWASALYDNMGNDFSNLLQSYLFSQMANAIGFKNALDKVTEYTELQNYELTMTEYGKIVYLLIFEIEPLTEDSGGLSEIIESGRSVPRHLLQFDSFGKALAQIQHRVPSNLIFNHAALTTGEVVAAAITIVSSLGIAAVFEMERQGIELVPREAQDELFNFFNYDMSAPEVYRRVMYSKDALDLDELGEMIIDHKDTKDISSAVIEGLAKAWDGSEASEETVEYTKEQLKPLTYVIEPLIEVVKGATEATTTTHAERLDKGSEVLFMLLGFKDGMVGVTGEESHFSFCNNNISQIPDVFYYNYYNIFESQETMDLNFNTENFRDSQRLIANYVKNSFQNPYFIVFSCYWAGVEVYTPINEQDVPNLLPQAIYDMAGEYATFVELFTNVVFNLGYLISDVFWMVELNDSQDNYWYRTGYVTGDIYMRFFFRNTYSAPVT